MKKKLLVLVAMLLCVVTVLASCAASMKFEKVVGDGTYNDENPTLTTAAEVDLKGNYRADLSAGDLAIFDDYNSETGLHTYTVYNVATGATVWTGTDSKTESGATTTRVMLSVFAREQWDTTWFNVTTTTATTVTEPADYSSSKTVKLYSAAGTEFASATDVYSFQTSTALDLILFNEKVYRIADDGTIAAAFDYSALRGSSLPAVTSKVGDFYYAPIFVEIEDSYEAIGIQVYNSSLELTSYFEKPSYISGNFDATMAPLNNGNVLIQYSVLENDMAEDYTYISNGSKYTLYTFILNVENGKAKEINLDYVVEDVTVRDMRYNHKRDYWAMRGIDQKIENLATVYLIENDRINRNESAAKVAVMANNGKIKGMVDGLIDNMMPGAVVQVATNRWVVSNLSEQMFLLNEEGEVLGEVTNADLEEYVGKPYFILNGKIYDWDLTVKYDMLANKAHVELELNHGVLMKNEDGELLLYANGEVKTLIAKDVENKYWSGLVIGFDGHNDEIFSGEGFVIMTEGDDTIKYEFYNDLGTVVLTVENVELDEDLFVCSADSTNAFMITGEKTVDGVVKTVYYRFS